jgi:hypothetical protein
VKKWRKKLEKNEQKFEKEKKILNCFGAHHNSIFSRFERRCGQHPRFICIFAKQMLGQMCFFTLWEKFKMLIIEESNWD